MFKKLFPAVLFIMILSVFSCTGGIKEASGDAPSYSVTYNGNASTGGTVPVDANEYKKGQLVTIPGNPGALVKAGFSFTGWCTGADGTGSSYAQGQTMTMGNTDVTLYAKWTQNLTYSVNYNANDAAGGSAPVDTTRYEAGQTVTVPGNTGNLTKTGYAFAGWNTQANGSGITYTQGQTFSMGAIDLTLYAKWTSNPTYTIHYDGNAASAGTVPVDATHYEAGQTVTVADNTGNLEKTNYGFVGWNTQPNGSGTAFAAGATFTMESENVTLYAQWNPMVSEVSVGLFHTMIVKSDGTLWATGYNYFGQLGDGTNEDKNTPVQVMTNVASVSAGDLHTMIVKTDGTLWATGYNYFGQLGDGTNEDKNTPVQIMSNVASVFTGYVHTMILKTDGTLWGTGYNACAQFGNGTNDSTVTPIQVYP
jgi:uncharacterized repeat protein (TIGR02543 family)